MPLYDYECTGCHLIFEEISRISQCDDPQPCPSCGRNGVRVFVPGSLTGHTWQDNPSWVREFHHYNQDESERPPETRAQLKSYLKQHGQEPRN